MGRVSREKDRVGSDHPQNSDVRGHGFGEERLLSVRC